MIHRCLLVTYTLLDCVALHLHLSDVALELYSLVQLEFSLLQFKPHLQHLQDPEKHKLSLHKWDFPMASKLPHQRSHFCSQTPWLVNGLYSLYDLDNVQ